MSEGSWRRWRRPTNAMHVILVSVITSPSLTKPFVCYCPSMASLHRPTCGRGLGYLVPVAKIRPYDATSLRLVLAAGSVSFCQPWRSCEIHVWFRHLFLDEAHLFHLFNCYSISAIPPSSRFYSPTDGFWSLPVILLIMVGSTGITNPWR